MLLLVRQFAIIIIPVIGSMSGAHAEQVPPAYRAIAREERLPASLLYAVALTESGQSKLSRQQFRPWPWTLNVDGQGQYFRTRTAAWRALQRALADDKRSVDIGLMQINWRYHQQILGSAWQALEPYHNLRVGAAILRQCSSDGSGWWESAGCYHAPSDPIRAAHYRARVRNVWRQVAEEGEIWAEVLPL